MNSVVAFFLGVITILIILFSFWFIATINTKVGKAYSNSVCHNVINNDINTRNQNL